MADTPTATPLVLGPWKGIDQRGASTDHVRNALNVEFTPEGAKRRKGRVRWMQSFGARRVSGLFTWARTDGVRELVATLAGEGEYRALVVIHEDQTFTYYDLTDWYARWRTYARFTPSEWQMPVEGLSVNGHLVLAEPDGRLLDFNGEKVTLLEAFNGKDAMLALSGANVYLPAPPEAKSMTTWRNRLVAAGEREIGLSSEDDEFLVPEEAPVGGPNVWPSLSNLSLIDPESDEIATVLVHYDRLVVLGVRSVHIVDEDGAQPVAREVDRTRGCFAPASAVNAGRGIIYLSHGHVCEFDGTSVEDISGPIWETMGKVNWRAAHRAVACHVRQKHEYWIWLPMEGSDDNCLNARFNYKTREWSLHAVRMSWLGYSMAGEASGITCACSFTNDRGEEFIFTGDQQGNVWLEDALEGSENGLPMPAWIETYLAPSPRSSRVAFSDMRIYGLMDGLAIGAKLLEDGQDADQALLGILTGEVPEDVAVERMDLEAQRLWSDADPYPDTPVSGRFDFHRMPLQAVGLASSVLLLMPGSVSLSAALSGVAGSYADLNTARGCLQTLEITATERPSKAA